MRRSRHAFYFVICSIVVKNRTCDFDRFHVFSTLSANECFFGMLPVCALYLDLNGWSNFIYVQYLKSFSIIVRPPKNREPKYKTAIFSETAITLLIAFQ
jgi:hypothetical protein